MGTFAIRVSFVNSATWHLRHRCSFPSCCYSGEPPRKTPGLQIAPIKIHAEIFSIWSTDHPDHPDHPDHQDHQIMRSSKSSDHLIVWMIWRSSGSGAHQSDVFQQQNLRSWKPNLESDGICIEIVSRIFVSKLDRTLYQKSLKFVDKKLNRITILSFLFYLSMCTHFCAVPQHLPKWPFWIFFSQNG